MFRQSGYFNDTPNYDPVNKLKPKIMSCPSQTRALPITPPSYQYTVLQVSNSYHYGVNNHLARTCDATAITNGTARVRKMTLIRTPSQAVLMFDANYYSLNVYNEVRNSDGSGGSGFVARHSDFMNILFLDGHVGSWKRTHLLYMKTQRMTPIGNPAWCSEQ